MPTPQGVALLEAHRLEQGKLARLTAAQMLKIFPLLVAGGKIDINTPLWLRTALALLQKNRSLSAALAARYMTAYRVVELGPDVEPIVISPVAALNVEQATTSLMVTGPVAYRREVARQLGEDVSHLTADDIAQARLSQAKQADLAAATARAGMRHVRNGGRETMESLPSVDKRVIGYMRQTDGDPCFFCAMLASRGPVYQDDSFADSDPRFSGPGNHKVHDGCGCDVVPLYTKGNEESVVAKLREYERMWIDSGNVRRQEGGSALNAFRRLYERPALHDGNTSKS